MTCSQNRNCMCGSDILDRDVYIFVSSVITINIRVTRTRGECETEGIDLVSGISNTGFDSWHKCITTSQKTAVIVVLVIV